MEIYDLKDLDIILLANINNIIEFIGFYEELLHKEKNLIGMLLDYFISHTDEKYYGEVDKTVIDDNGRFQYVYEFEDIDLQVWLGDSYIVSIMVNSQDHYKD